MLQRRPSGFHAGLRGLLFFFLRPLIESQNNHPLLCYLASISVVFLQWLSYVAQFLPQIPYPDSLPGRVRVVWPPRCTVTEGATPATTAGTTLLPSDMRSILTHHHWPAFLVRCTHFPRLCFLSSSHSIFIGRPFFFFFL